MDEKTLEIVERLVVVETELRHLRDDVKAARSVPPMSGKLLFGFFSSREAVFVAAFLALTAIAGAAAVLALLLAGQGAAIADFARALKGG